MADPDQSRVRNRILSGMLAEDFARLAPYLEYVEYASPEKVLEVGQPISVAAFPETCISSVIARSPRGVAVETGLAGYEGMFEIGAALGAATSFSEVTVQVPGAAHRIDARALRAEMEASSTLRTRILHFAHSFVVQVSYAALLNTSFSIEERLARWLLMCHDRIEGDELQLTHDFLSMMLGVRRPSVTVAMHMLEGERFVRARRARITISDRAGLEEFASEAYGRPKDAYEQVLGPLRKQATGAAAAGR